MESKQLTYHAKKKRKKDRKREKERKKEKQETYFRDDPSILLKEECSRSNPCVFWYWQ